MSFVHVRRARYSSVGGYLSGAAGLPEGAPVEVYGRLGTVVKRGSHDATAGPAHLFRDSKILPFQDLDISDGLSIISGSADVLSRDGSGNLVVSLTETNPALILKVDAFGTAWGIGMATLIVTQDPSSSDSPTTDSRCAVKLHIEGSADDGHVIGQSLYWTGAAWAERLIYDAGAGELTASAGAISGSAPWELMIYARGRGTTVAQDPLGAIQGNLPAIAAGPGGTTNIAWLSDTTDTARVASVRIDMKLVSPGASNTATFKLHGVRWIPALGREAAP